MEVSNHIMLPSALGLQQSPSPGAQIPSGISPLPLSILPTVTHRYT